MPRDVKVTFADGESVVMAGVPDNATPEQVAGRARNQFGKAVAALDGSGGKMPAEPGLLDKVKREAGLVASDVAKGLGALPALFVDLNAPQGQAAADMAMAMIPGRKEEPTTADRPLQFGASKALGDLGVKPETSRERWQSSITQGVVGAAVGPGSALMKVASGLGSGVGAEVAGRLSSSDPEKQSPWMRLLGGVAGGLSVGGAAGLASRARPQTQALAQDAMRGVSDEAIAVATKVREEAAKRGVDMDWAQALEAAGAPSVNMSTLRDATASTAGGARLQALAKTQPVQLELAADTAVGGLPGPVMGPAAATNAVTKAATDRLMAEKLARTAAVQGDYAKVGFLPGGSVGRLTRVVMERVAGPGTSAEAKQVAQEFVDRIQEAAKSRGGLHALDVDIALSDAMGAFKQRTLGSGATRGSLQVKSLGKALNSEFQSLSPAIKAAEAKFARISAERVNPLKQGVVGQLAGRGYADDVQASGTRLEQLFAKGSDTQIDEPLREIPVAMRELSKVDKEAAPAAVKAFLRERLGKAFNSSPGETVKQAAGGNDSARVVYDSLFKRRAQLQGVKDMVAGSARSMGLPKAEVDEAVRGIESLAQITRGLASTPPHQGVSWQEIARKGGESNIADAARIWSFLPAGKFAARVEEATLDKTFRQLDSLLTTPEGLQTLRELSRTPVMSKKAQVLLSTFGATATSNDE